MSLPLLSVGIEATFSARGSCRRTGLKDLAHFIVNEYNRRVRAGESSLCRASYKGFLEGFLRSPRRRLIGPTKEYFGYNLRYYWR